MCQERNQGLQDLGEGFPCACRDTVQDFSDILGALYLSVLFLGIINAMSVQSVVFFQRSVLYREYAAGESCLCSTRPCRDQACCLCCAVCSPAHCGLASKARGERAADCLSINLGLILAPAWACSRSSTPRRHLLQDAVRAVAVLRRDPLQHPGGRPVLCGTLRHRSPRQPACVNPCLHALCLLAVEDTLTLISTPPSICCCSHGCWYLRGQPSCSTWTWQCPVSAKHLHHG